MPRRIPENVRVKISKLYDNGGGMSLSEISKQTGVSYSSVYGMTRLRQRTNSERGRYFKSRTEYDDWRARQRAEKNKEFSTLLKYRLNELGKNQSWLAEQLGVTRQAVSLYTQGKLISRGEKFNKLLKILNINGKRKSIENMIK